MQTRYKVGALGATIAVAAAFFIGEFTGPQGASAVNPNVLSASQVALAKNVALRAAAADGDATPSAITAVATTRSTALTAFGADDTSQPDQAALAILVRGNFSTAAFDLPPGTKAVPFNELIVVVDAATGQTLNVLSADTATRTINLATLGVPASIQ